MKKFDAIEVALNAGDFIVKAIEIVVLTHRDLNKAIPAIAFDMAGLKDIDLTSLTPDEQDRAWERAAGAWQERLDVLLSACELWQNAGEDFEKKEDASKAIGRLLAEVLPHI